MSSQTDMAPFNQGAGSLRSRVESKEWSKEALALGQDLSPEIREKLKNHWLREASLEHASVASFSRASLQLIALGAPPDLLTNAHVSAVDEVRHARLSYTLASAYAGEGYGPGPLPVDGLNLDNVTAEEVAVETFLDGCLNETVAALVARAGSEQSQRAVIQEALLSIAEDEERHAELAWRTLAWLVRDFGPTVYEAVQSIVEEVAHSPAPAPDGEPLPEELRREGMVSPETQVAIRQQALSEIVLPCAYAILQSVPTRQ